ncbi:MAG TPA: hypothetical protein VH298_07275 [Jatrophihabitans sp.]|nr:hypothetical protein [Jatrophihabitans sp.]
MRTAAALILVMVGCLAAIVLLPRLFDRHPPSHGLTVLRTVPLAAQPGLNRITVHGLTVSVPASWHQVIGHPCSVTTDLVMLSVSASPDCGTGRAKNISTVEFVEGQLGTSLVAKPPTDIRIDGVAATRTTFSDIVANYIVVGVPSLQVSVEIGAPSAAGAEQLQATLRITAGDAHGCPSKAASSRDLNALVPASRAGADRSLLPAGASAVTLCRYQDGWLEQGAALPASNLAAFIASMNALPAGLSKAHDHQGLACRSGGDAAGNLSGQSAQDSASYLLFADYPSGPAVTVIVRLALCGDLGASNGIRTAQRTSELISLVTALAGDAQSYPQQVSPA